MLKKIVFSVCCTAVSISCANAMESEKKATASIGTGLGWVEANGLSYRKYFDDQYVQFTFAGAYDKAKKQEYFDASMSYGKYLATVDTGHFFPMALKFVTGVELERDADRKNDLVDAAYLQAANELHAGAGFGVDIGSPQRKGFGASVNALYTASFRDYSKMEFVRLGLLPAASIYYNY